MNSLLILRIAMVTHYLQNFRLSSSINMFLAVLVLYELCVVLLVLVTIILGKGVIMFFKYQLTTLYWQCILYRVSVEIFLWL